MTFSLYDATKLSNDLRKDEKSFEHLVKEYESLRNLLMLVRDCVFGHKPTMWNYEDLPPKEQAVIVDELRLALDIVKMMHLGL